MARKEITNEVLKGLYYGDCDVIEESLSEVEGYKECLHNLNEKMAIIDSTLDSTQNELLTQYLALRTELAGNRNCTTDKKTKRTQLRPLNFFLI